MYPNQNQYSIDYLNEIAPQPQKSGLNNKKFMLIVGGGLLLAIIVGFFAFSSGGSAGPKEKMQTLSARIQTLHMISDKAQKNIKSGPLRSTNSNLTIFLSDANHDSVEPFKAVGVDTKHLDKDITTAEKGEELSTKLEDARLNAVFDRTYAREMSYQLDTIAALMKEIHSKTKNKPLKEFLVSTDANLQAIKKQLYDFNAANG